MGFLEAIETGRYFEWVVFFPFFFFPALAFYRYYWVVKIFAGAWLFVLFGLFFDFQRYDVLMVGALAVALVYRHELLSGLLPRQLL